MELRLNACKQQTGSSKNNKNNYENKVSLSEKSEKGNYIKTAFLA